MSESEHGDNDPNPEETPPPLPNTKKRSLVWRFFERVNQFRVRCYLCQHQQNYQGTTGNILRHMKSKHDVDLTLKGQQDEENQKRIQELCSTAAAISGSAIKTENFRTPTYSRLRRKRKKSVHDNGYDVHDVKPHVEDNNNEDEEEEMHPVEKYETAQFLNEDSMEIPEEESLMISSTRIPKSQLEDDRIKAETKYFREKAGYYKLLKHLTALQAKKVKIEIELLTTADDNKIV